MKSIPERSKNTAKFGMTFSGLALSLVQSCTHGFNQAPCPTPGLAGSVRAEGDHASVIPDAAPSPRIYDPVLDRRPGVVPPTVPIVSTAGVTAIRDQQMETEFQVDRLLNSPEVAQLEEFKEQNAGREIRIARLKRQVEEEESRGGSLDIRISNLDARLESLVKRKVELTQEEQAAAQKNAVIRDKIRKLQTLLNE